MAGFFKTLKEKYNKSKKIIIQWFFPTIFFLAVIAVLFVASASNMQRAIRKMVEKQFEDAANYHAAAFYNVADNIKEVTVATSKLLDDDSRIRNGNIKAAIPYLSAAKESENIFEAWYVTADGKGIDAAGDTVEVQDNAVLIAITSKQPQYIVTTYNDGKRNVIAYVQPLKRSKSAYISFYDPDIFQFDTYVFRLDTHTWYAVMDDNGNILSVEPGATNNIDKDSNILNDLSEAQFKNYDYDRMLSTINSGNMASFFAECKGNQRYYVMLPVRINSWYLVISTPQEYVKFLNNKIMQSIYYMVLYVVLAVILFIVVIIAIAIANKRKMSDQNKTLKVKAETDLLTELNNKISTEQKIREFITEHPKGQGMLFVIDIDNFKKINDTMGHAFGDEVLRSIASRLKMAFRATDVVGRFGGDEFVVFLKNINTDELIKKEAGKLIGIFTDFKVGDYTKYTVTASIGCAIYSKDGNDFETLFKAADVGVYRAKRTGKNRLVFYNDQYKTFIGQDV